MKIVNIQTLGTIIRCKRKELGFTQKQLASICNTGTRFISELENGKATIEIGKTFNVLNKFGLSFFIDSESKSFSQTNINSTANICANISPEERLAAFLNHCELITQFANLGSRSRER